MGCPYDLLLGFLAEWLSEKDCLFDMVNVFFVKLSIEKDWVVLGGVIEASVKIFVGGL